MARDSREYIRLTGKVRALDRTSFSFAGASCSLWLGRDHVLSIEHGFGSERYRRFFFRDIQAIIVRRTTAGRTFNIVCAVLTGLLAVGAVLSALWDGDTFLVVFWSVLASLPPIPLVINAFRGATCTCHFQTAVQNEAVPALSRLPTARKVLPRLADMIRTWQQDLAREVEDGPVSAEPPRAVQQGPIPALLRQDARARRAPKAIDSSYNGRVHLWYFIAQLVQALLAGTGLLVSATWPFVLGIAPGMLSLVLLVLALVKQARCRVAGFLSWVTWLCLGAAVASFISGQALFTFMAVDDPWAAGTQWQQIMRMYRSAISGSTPAFFVISIVAVIDMFLGVMGLFAVREHRRQVRLLAATPPPVPPVPSAGPQAGSVIEETAVSMVPPPLPPGGPVILDSGTPGDDPDDA